MGYKIPFPTLPKHRVDLGVGLLVLEMHRPGTPWRLQANRGRFSRLGRFVLVCEGEDTLSSSHPSTVGRPLLGDL